MWYEESVVYQIYPLGFCGAPPDNDGAVVPRLRKILDWVPHLEGLGVDAVYLCPVWQSDRHGYDTRDFRTLDCRLGANADLKAVCDGLHAAGIRVILDGVFHHVGRGFWAFQDLLRRREQSPYRDWFCHVDFWGNNQYGDGLSYEGWEGHNELVKLNLQNGAVVGHILESVGEWIDEYGIDGLRLDVAYSLPHDFIRQLRRFTDGKKQDFFLLGEVIHGDYGQLMGEGLLHSVTNYQAYKGLWSSFNSANFFEIHHSLIRQFHEQIPGKHPMNFVENHDVDRVASILRESAHLPLIYGLLFAMPGIPCLYYGGEWGAQARRSRESDAPLRPCFPAPEETELTRLIARLAQIHKAHKALCYGSYSQVFLTNRQIVFERAWEGERILCAINLDAQEFRANFSCGADRGEDLLTGETVDLAGGCTLPAFSLFYLKI